MVICIDIMVVMMVISIDLMMVMLMIIIADIMMVIKMVILVDIRLSSELVPRSAHDVVWRIIAMANTRITQASAG